MNKFFIWIKSIAIPLIVGGITSFIISKSIDYNTLNQPPLSPPSIAFPIVWTILYILMGISYAILKTNSKLDDSSKLIYYIQLGINALWSIFFFNLKWRLFAFIWILLLIISIIIMIINFYNRKPIAGILQIPYLIWTLFAAYLNLGVYILNG